jgi:hypothetical protein
MSGLQEQTGDPTPEQLQARRDEGYKAFFDGLTINQNPYERAHEALERAWKTGWYAAKREAEEEEQD